MRTLSASVLLLLAVDASDAADAPAPPHSAAPAVPVQRLTPADAYRLSDKRGLWYVRVQWTLPGPRSATVCECRPPEGAVARAWLRAGQPVGDTMTVEATLRVIRHPACTVRGRFFPAFTEYRLQGAVRRD